MDKILDNLFYNEKLGVGDKTTFIKKVQEKHPELKTKVIQAYLKNQDINQVNTTVNKSYDYKLTAPLTRSNLISFDGDVVNHYYHFYY
jgi:hypothetical protein